MLPVDYYKIRLISSFTAWINRFANAGDAALEVAENTANRVGMLTFLFFFPFTVCYIFHNILILLLEKLLLMLNSVEI